MNADLGRPAGRVVGRGRVATALLAALVLAACQAGGAGRTGAGRDVTAPTVAAPPEATRPNPPPVPAAQASFRFDQILGVPTNKQDTLAREIATYAKGRNLTLVRRGDPTASYRLLGFLSAVGGDAGVNVTYVWDIVDANNNRLHRITGVEVASTAEADPWSGVGDQVLAAVAARTVEQVYAWVNQRPAAGAPPAAVAAAPQPGRAI
ncbi:hypothetical protein [Oharaeibacter diazotrophicus]|uniref:Lipoprotein n=2 Tax=Oharaeibacter diazotrophicus TaxID=1920512 RepID=A0A4R6R9S2_9HYPH|nr:hypothetical protein [Oharaeibacter diazotrophicus]TDP82615.1 hypothetical protein EDD54_3884 [Oharaeibacter diazotrophicus]BBE72621.1 hypothetical protein OHA_1_02219 [Pleomorphomonas sp. SM30]GLS76655.1 hypothetical protein GCM10007904_19920 [Oharaeibacter diazotrophicus]